MNITNLYYDNKEDIYYYTDLETDCDYCKETIENIVFIKLGWDRLGSDIKHYCFNCRDKNVSYARITETIRAIVEEDISDEFIPYSYKKPSLQNSTNMSNIDVASLNIANEQTIDKTIFAGRESLEGATIGNQDLILKLDKADNKLLSIDEGLSLLDSLAKAQPLIEQGEHEIKQLKDEVQKDV